MLQNIKNIYNFVFFSSTTTSVQKVITTSKNLSCGWHASWLGIQIWNLLLCLRYCRQKLLWIHSGSNRSRKISRKLKKRHYQKTTKTFSLFNTVDVAFTESKAYYTSVPWMYRALVFLHIKIEDSFFEESNKYIFTKAIFSSINIILDL